MRSITVFLFLLFFFPFTGYAGPLINEISAGGESDWVEITLSADTESCDISDYFVTMYYGTNEKIAASPATLRKCDLPETPYDDRFAVVHFTKIPTPDETDAAGDINGNGIRDLFCCNYGLWTSDCAVSIDTDDTPENGGIADFVAFSNRDGSANNTVAGYINCAAAAGEWRSSGTDIQQCAVDIGGGLKSYSTISRIKGEDTDSLNDFKLTSFATPGRENIINPSGTGKKLFSTSFKNRSHIMGSGTISIPLFLYRSCSVKIRIFNSAGFTVYTSGLKQDLNPGYYTFEIPEAELRGRILTGLYPVKIEAAGKGSSLDDSIVYLVIKGGR